MFFFYCVHTQHTSTQYDDSFFVVDPSWDSSLYPMSQRESVVDCSAVAAMKEYHERGKSNKLFSSSSVICAGSIIIRDGSIYGGSCGHFTSFMEITHKEMMMATAMLLPQRRKQNTERISNIKKKSLMFFRFVITLYSVAAIAAKEIFLIKQSTKFLF